MELKQHRSASRLSGIAIFFQKFPLPGPRGERLMKEFTASVTAIHGAADKQGLAKFTRTGHKDVGRRLRLALRRGQMLGIARDAAGHFKGEERILRALKVPHASASVRTLVTSAEVMGKTLKPHVRELRAYDITRARLLDLERAARELKQWGIDAPKLTDRGTIATRDLKAAVSASNVLKKRVEAMVMFMALTDRTIWANWKAYSRLGKKPGRPRKGTKPRRPAENHLSDS